MLHTILLSLNPIAYSTLILVLDVIHRSFKMFDFLPVGGITALTGLIFISFIGWRLIPKSSSSEDAGKELIEIATYVSNLLVTKNSSVVNKKLFEIYSEAEKFDVAILGVVRKDIRIDKGSKNIELQENDQLLIDATPEELDEFRSLLKLDFPFNKNKILAESENFFPCEVAVTEESRLVGRTASKVGLGWRKSTILLGISRKGRPIKRQTRKTVIRAGDILLLLIPKETYTDVINWLNCLPLADRGLNITNTNKMKIALLVFFFVCKVPIKYLPLLFQSPK